MTSAQRMPSKRPPPRQATSPPVRRPPAQLLSRAARREAQRHHCAAKRSATSSFSREETAQRRNQRQRADSEDREAAGAETATKKFTYIARLWGVEAAAEVMRKGRTRCPPDVVLEHPHQAGPEYHEDWTLVEGSNWDPEKWQQEQELRERRNILIRLHLIGGRSVFYKSSGQSLWPLVLSLIHI